MRIRTKANNPGCWDRGEEFEVLSDARGRYIIESQTSEEPGRKFHFEWDFDTYMKHDFVEVSNPTCCRMNFFSLDKPWNWLDKLVVALALLGIVLMTLKVISQ